MMAKSLEIPQDIIDSVIVAVGEDTRLLKQCALVSSSFLLPSRKQLFSRITLRDAKTCEGIHRFLDQNSIIQSSVEAITLAEDKDSPKYTDLPSSISLPAFLRLPFSHLECLSIMFHHRDLSFDWNEFSSELKDALSNIIHSLNLKTLFLRGITKIPTTFFLHIVHLTTLELCYVLPIDSGYEISNSLTRASNEVAPKTHVVIDQFIWHLRHDYDYGRSTIFPFICLFFTNSGHKVPTRPRFLPFMCHLRFFQIFAHLGSATTYNFCILSFLMGSLSISLTSPATLEHLEFNISFHFYPEEFICNDIFHQDLRKAHVWSHLDSIATHATGSRLQRVDINIDYSFYEYKHNYEPNEDKVVEAILDGLPLLRKKDILFVKARCEGSMWH